MEHVKGLEMQAEIRGEHAAQQVLSEDLTRVHLQQPCAIRQHYTTQISKTAQSITTPITAQATQDSTAPPREAQHTGFECLGQGALQKWHRGATNKSSMSRA